MQVTIEITADSSDERAVQAVAAVADALAGRAITQTGESSEVRVLEEMAAELEETRAERDAAVTRAQGMENKATEQDQQNRAAALAASKLSRQVDELREQLLDRDGKLTEAHDELKKIQARSRDRERDINTLQSRANKTETKQQQTIDGLRTRVSQLDEQLKTALDEIEEWKTWAEDNGMVEYVDQEESADQ